ncbi:MAG: hypothetical protein WAU32_03510, partial [Thermoanaerobaculia bacterium]
MCGDYSRGPGLSDLSDQPVPGFAAVFHVARGRGNAKFLEQNADGGARLDPRPPQHIGARDADAA